jgi:hypothetical protein
MFGKRIRHWPMKKVLSEGPRAGSHLPGISTVSREDRSAFGHGLVGEFLGDVGAAERAERRLGQAGAALAALAEVGALADPGHRDGVPVAGEVGEPGRGDGDFAAGRFAL